MSIWSASQASHFLLCARAWAFERIEGHKRPGSKSTELGKAVHAILEFLLVGKQSFDIPPEIHNKAYCVAWAMFSKLPIGRTLAVEGKLQRGNWLGYLDLVFEPEPGIVGVSDHKTRRGLDRYVPTSSELALDLQATIYVYLVAGAYGLPGDAIVPLWWTFGQTEGAAKAKPVRSSLRVAEAERRVALLDQTVVARGNALRMARPPANSVEPNPAACNRYGGCPHRERCELTAEQRLLGMIQEQQQQEDDMTTLWTTLEKELGGGPYQGVNRPESDYAPQAPAQPQGQPPYSAPAQAAPQALAQPQGHGQGPRPGYGFILLVGCTAQGARSLAPILREANARASAAAKVQDYRSVDYGCGPGLLLTHCRPLLDQSLTEGMIIEVDPHSPEVQAVLVELESRASITVRGCR